MTPKVVYFIEHVARELDIACAVKAYLENEHQISTHIASISVNLQKTLSKFTPEVVLIPYGTSIDNQGLRDIIAFWPEAKYINLSFEQLLGKIQKGFKTPRDQFAKEFLLYSAWGDFFASFLEEHGIPDERIVINGSPTANLYQPPFSQFYPSQKALMGKEYGLDPQKRWILIPENYGWAFFNDKLVEHRIKGGYDADLAYDYREFSHRSLKKVSEWWSRPDIPNNVEVIIRPRPAIPTEIFINKVKSFAGDLPSHIHFIKDKTVREWILASDVVMSSYSTTLVEAAIAGKSVYMLTPYQIPDLLYNEWYDHCPKINTFSEYQQALTEENANWQPLQAWVADTFAFDQNAPQNIANTAVKVLSGEIELDSPTSIAAELERPTRMGIFMQQTRKKGWQASQAIKRGLGLPASNLSNPFKDDRVHQHIVDAKVNKWKKVLEL